MKKTNLFTALLLLLAGGIFGQDADGKNLFDDSFLHEIKFELADTNLFITTKDYQNLRMIIDGNTVDSVGFKRKGNSSQYTDPNKKAIKIKTNKYVKGKEYDGTKEFTLHINFQDPTMMREKLTYDICADMGLFSLRTAFAKVYINNNYWGLYTIIEGKGEMYKQTFDNRDMDAIESLDFGTMCFISNTPSDYDEDNNGGNPTYKHENGEEATAWPRFAKMIDKANNTLDDQYLDTVSTYLNLKDFFRYQAINVFLMNMDSYISFRGNQVYVYDEVANLWQVTPWDFNASFGLWNTNNYISSTYPMIPPTISNGCIAGKLNDIPELKEYYLDAMCELNNTIGDTTAYFNKIDQWKAQIQEAVYTDTRKHVSNTDFDKGIEYGFHRLFGENQPALKTFIKQRLAVIQQGLNSENYNCRTTVGLHDRLESNSISIFPNPAKNSLKIDFDESIFEPKSIKIFNSFGQLVIHQNWTSNDINIENLQDGIYFLILESHDNSNQMKKIIKQ